MAKKEEPKKEFVNETRELCKKLGIIYAGDFPDHPIWTRKLSVSFGGRQLTPEARKRLEAEAQARKKAEEEESGKEEADE